ncbi:hypothetical protein J8E27_07865 [Brucella sp. 458]|uniref:hypothetical protein n=1 Tax=Brucella sp. 458 TaxID=2821140 RepID=UPI001ADF3F45|nr:hypothetical protein [Brucella sp. 458]QTN98182.1 hypothetical protein J8E27_07865 [Brucella sp. 458]
MSDQTQTASPLKVAHTAAILKADRSEAQAYREEKRKLFAASYANLERNLRR